MKKLILTAVILMSTSFANAGTLTEQFEREKFFDSLTGVYLVLDTCKDNKSQLLILQGVEHLYETGSNFANIKGTNLENEWNLSIMRSVGNPNVRTFNQKAMLEGSKKSNNFISACNSMANVASKFYNSAKGL